MNGALSAASGEARRAVNVLPGGIEAKNEAREPE